MAKYGRRNFMILGSFIIFISNLGFVVLHYLEGETMFIIGFILLRVLQGIGTGCLQTANYSILSLMYPEMVEFAVGCLEASAGIGLCFGPIIGVGIFQIGGYVAPFAVFSLIFLIF